MANYLGEIATHRVSGVTSVTWGREKCSAAGESSMRSWPTEQVMVQELV